MNFHDRPPSSERQTPLFVGSGGGGCCPRPPPPAPPPRCPGGTRLPSSFTPAPVPPDGPTSICARITLGLVRQMSSPMRPMIALSGRPLPVTFVHVFPASVVFQMALLGPPPLKP